MKKCAGFILFVWPFLALAQNGIEGFQKWQPTLESISLHETPEWLMDAKIGIQFVGEPQEFDDVQWYHWSRAMQRARQLGFDESDEQLRKHKDGVKVVGGIPYAWDVSPAGDPGKLMDAYKRTGAKYLVSMLQAAYPGTEGLRMMPGEVELARKNGFRVGLHYNLLRRDGLPSMGDPGYVEWWHSRVKDEVEIMGSDFLFFDGCQAPSAYFKTPELVSWYYNQAESLGKEVWVNEDLGTDTRESLEHGDVHEGEGFTMSGVSAKHFLNWDMIRNEWNCWVNEFGINKRDGSQWEWAYKPVDELLQLFIYNVSMGGGWVVQMVNTQQAWENMWEIGDWLAVNGEAIYGTRPYYPADASARRLPDHRAPIGHDGTKHWMWRFDQTVDVARSGGPLYMTRKQERVYAIRFGWPGETLTIPGVRAKKRSAIRMLGVDEELEWKQKGDDLIILLPPEKPCDYAYSFSIEEHKKK